ncbi:unnamed protein product [Ostreobium quekettii]|uniref:Uncharacterized protein n=1 Tax=Ostreobium quekettii TaxID=121088 RepID=A0A8S1J3Q6_9CHLO|nr:unnamed protein product [Ostreobium quekettii]
MGPKSWRASPERAGCEVIFKSVSDVESLAPAALAGRTGHRIEIQARDVLVSRDAEGVEARWRTLRTEFLAQAQQMVSRGLLLRRKIRGGLRLQVRSSKDPLGSF